MRRILEGVLLCAIGAGVVLAVYDAGKRSVVRDCWEFRTFTYGDTAWFCKQLRTAREREVSEAEKRPADEFVEI